LGAEELDMTIYRFRVYLLPNSHMEFEPETGVWRDIEVDSRHTLADLHETIFDAYDRYDTHAYEFLTRDEHGIATRSYAHPQMYSGDKSWHPMDDNEINRFLEHAIPDDASQAAKQRFRELRKNPPDERNAAETAIGDLDLDDSQSLFYEFDFGDSWEHHIDIEEIRQSSLDGKPVVVDKQGEAPSQYPERSD